MAKRFRETERRKEARYRVLPCRIKLAWDYINDDCDNSGVWPIDMGALSFHVGEPVTLEEITENFPALVFDSGNKLYLTSFVSFQYGDANGQLSQNNKWHKDIARKLSALKLPDPDWKSKEVSDLSNSNDKSLDTPSTPHRHPIDTLSTPYRQGGGEGQGRGRGRGRGRGNVFELGGVGDFETQSADDAQVLELPQATPPGLAVNENTGEIESLEPFHAEPEIQAHEPKRSQEIIPELDGDLTPEARELLLQVAPSAQRAWLKSYPDPEWIKQQLHARVAHYGPDNPDPIAHRSAGARLGSWLGRGWPKRDINRGSTAYTPTIKKPDWSKIKW